MIRKAAIHSKAATKKSMNRALKKHFPSVESLTDLKVNPEHKTLHLTLQGLIF